MQQPQLPKRGALAWNESPASLRVVRVVAIAAWVAFIASLLTVGVIETASLRQPAVAEGQFVHPHPIKGTIRFFSDGQERIYRVAKPAMLLSWLSCMVLFGAYLAIERRVKLQKAQHELARHP